MKNLSICLFLFFALISLNSDANENRTRGGDEDVYIYNASSDPEPKLSQHLYHSGDIVNVINKETSTANISVKDDSGTTMLTVYPGSSGRLICTTNPCDTEDDWEGMSTVTSKWTSYTPTFTAFGTTSNPNFHWRRVGDTLEIKGRFTVGTPAANEARISFPTGLTSAGSAKIGTLELAGMGVRNGTDANHIHTLIEQSTSYITFGLRSGGSAGLTKRNGSDIINSGEILSVYARIPIANWEQNRDQN